MTEASAALSRSPGASDSRTRSARRCSPLIQEECSEWWLGYMQGIRLNGHSTYKVGVRDVGIEH